MKLLSPYNKHERQWVNLKSVILINFTIMLVFRYK